MFFGFCFNINEIKITNEHTIINFIKPLSIYMDEMGSKIHN
jgi:hypothetical protein